MLKLSEYGRIGEIAWFDELPNGLRLCVVPKPDYKKSMAFFATNYGGVDRRFKLSGKWMDTPAGVAHFLEHKMFDMEDGENALTILSERGASANAFTSSDITAYHFECTDMFFENLELLLKFVSTPYFTEESVQKERGIIGQEIKMVEDEPDYAVYYGLVRSLFKHNPVRDAVAGSVESIEKITAETLYGCHRAFYTPSNMTLAVVGNQDPQKIRDMAVRLLPEYNAPYAERDYGAAEGELPADMRTERRMEVSAPIFLAGAKSESGLKGKSGARFELVASMAMSTLMGKATPLYNRLYSEGLVNDTFGYDFERTSGVSLLSFGGESKNPELVCLRVLEEAAKIAAKGVDEEFFVRRKKTTYGRIIRALNSFDSICYNLAAAGFDGYDYFETLDILDGITAEDVRSFIAKYVVPERTAISIIQKLER
ncbi:MAG: EF-P 5-aminopentanol modification-associated protein YfmH [Oscillospiraceae bacterium]